MTDKLISEGTFAMLKEIRDKMNNNPELNLMNERLEQIEKMCNDLVEKKLVTEDVLGQFFAHMHKQMAETNKKQDEKIEELKRYILGHHKDMKERVEKQREDTNVRLQQMEDTLKDKQENQGIFEGVRQWIKQGLSIKLYK